MAVLYLTDQGSRLNLEGNQFILTKDEEVLAQIPAGLVEAVYVFGNVSLTTPVIRYLLLQGIEGVFLSQEGRYFGRLISTDSRFGLLRQQQYLALANPDLRLGVARAMVFGKIRNQESLLSSCGLSSSEIQPLTALAEEALGASSHDHLLGIEGQASVLYYEFYRRLFKEDLGFRKRTRRPPRDPVNSLLSFGYTLLGYSAQSAVYLVGLDPFGGFLHSTHYSRPSLALDLAEEFRPMIDGLVLQVVNSCRYQLQDFRSSEENPSAVLLTDSARKRYLEDFEGVMNRAIKYPEQGKPVTVRRALELQARQVANIVLGKREKYNPIKLSFTTG